MNDQTVTRQFRRRSQRALRNINARLRRPGELNQAGRTPYETIAEHEIIKLRYYAPTVATGKTPLVIVPPLAVNMLIYDLFPQRSLVRYFRDLGFPVYLIDWGRPSREQAHYRFRTYLTEFLPHMLAQVRAHSGQQTLHLHGWSMGAIFSYAYTALGDADIDKLVLVGPPCDYHASGVSGVQNRMLSRQLKRVQSVTGWNVFRSPQALWHTPGWANSLGFKLMSPVGTVNGYLELLRRIDDPEFVASHATNAAFLDDMVAYPGGVMQDIIKFLITDNVLATGRLPVKDCEASLADIHSDVLIVIGDRDPIVTPAASRRLIELMPSARSELIEVPGGHMSIVSGSKAPELIWPRVARWLDGEPA